MKNRGCKHEKHIKFSFNDREFAILQVISKAKGFSSPQRWIRSEAIAFARMADRNIVCNENDTKNGVVISPLPSNIKDFYQRLACQHSTTFAAIITKMVVYPDIKEHLCKKEDNI